MASSGMELGRPVENEMMRSCSIEKMSIPTFQFSQVRLAYGNEKAPEQKPSPHDMRTGLINLGNLSSDQSNVESK